MTNFFFSPYGVLPGEFKDRGLDDKAVMKAWRPNDLDRITSFQKWQQDRLAEIAEYIWPKYEPTNDSWSGAAVGTAKALTELELEVMIAEFMKPNSVLEEHPVSPLAVPLIENQRQHYKYEDSEAPGFNFRQYDRTLDNHEEEAFLHLMLAAVTNKKLGIGEKIAGHFWFKSQLQRPRPLHAALRLDLETDFSSELSERGQHPSIVSGHCLQGIMMCCNVLEFWLANDPNVDPLRKESLAQYMVDIGDRRVFAGVHYPSDNIASWGTALSLIPEVFANPHTILDFVRHAIMQKSRVYQVIIQYYAHDNRATSAMQYLSNYNLIGAKV